MAFTPVTKGVLSPESFSIGTVKMQVVKFTAASGDTTGTVTADRLSRLDLAIVIGLTNSAAPTISGNAATLAFYDPAQTVAGWVICLGR